MTYRHPFLPLAGFGLVASLSAVLAQNPLQSPPAAPGAAPTTVPANPGAPQQAQQPEFPPVDQVLQGFERVVPTGAPKSFYTLWTKAKDGQLLAELPKDYAAQKHYLALTVSGGEEYAGLQAGDVYFYWKPYGKRLALVVPSLDIRSTGDKQSQDSIKRLFTDSVLVDVPIVTMGPGGGPVIDLDEIIIQNAEKFFGRAAGGLRRDLYKIQSVKAFQNNVELGVEAALQGGKIKSFHYSFSMLPDNTGYQPRKADERIGYFTTSYADFGKFTPEETQVRYINRWHLEKADPSLKLSPPKNPIIFYLEHTTPFRYRRWVKQGVELWNKAFERVGLVNAVQVYFQDATTGEHMDKDPEDVQYNFIRWLSNGEGTAIGPSRTHPLTGQILDADIILTDGWIRHWWKQYNDIVPQITMEGMTPESLAWLHQNPNWDPRVRLAPPERRAEVLDSITRSPMPAMGGHPLGKAMNSDEKLAGTSEFDGLVKRSSQFNGFCQAANWKTQGLALMDLAMAVGIAEGADPAPGDQILDGIPESFIGPLMADLVVHEVGHTLGLRHNFKASSIYTYDEIQSDAVKGKKPFSGSVMDYIPINHVAGKDKPKGDIGMIAVGPYDEWAIEYGYTFEKELKPILDRVNEPQLVYGTDEDTWGPDPRARRYDFSKDPLAYAENQIALAKEYRTKLLDKFVKDGESWAKARRGYQLTLLTQTQSVMMMANWLGGTYVSRARKADPNSGVPVDPVPVAQQRAAVQFVLTNTAFDEAWGLTPDLLKYMTQDQWWDMETQFDGPNWPVHDRILGIQASALTALLNPTALNRVYDNELRLAADQDALTLPELLGMIRDAVWKEVLQPVDANAKFTPRQPLISSLRRNLQREHLERLLDLAATAHGSSPASRPVSDLASVQLAELRDKVNAAAGNANVDAYTVAHLKETSVRITRQLESRAVFTR